MTPVVSGRDATSQPLDVAISKVALARRCRGRGTSTLIAVLTLALVALASTPAGAETITGTFKFIDSNGAAAPIRLATVEIWRYRPDRLWWAWFPDATTMTDAQGRIEVPMNFLRSGVIYGVRVFAKNRGVTVYTQDIYSTEFYRRPGEPGTPFERVVNASSDVLDFSFTFGEAYAVNHFNIADAVLQGFDYATALPRRTPTADDTVAPVSVLLASIGLTYFDPISHLLRVNAIYAMDDFTILHEYAHYLEERISSFQGIASYHDGCIATAGRGGVSVAGPDFAWMEGFASYFPQAVQMATGGLQFAPDTGAPLGSTSASTLESPSCPPSPLPLRATEDFVGGALFDIIDARSGGEPNDLLCRTTDNPIDNKVFQVFDSLELGFTNPTLQHFVDGWSNHGFDLPSLLTAFGSTAGGLVTPTPVLRYDNARAANIAIWRPSDGMWWVVGAQSGSGTQWGMRGDIPVPADYDGDGFTDLAVYRPEGGNWFVILSRTDRVQVTQWGQPYDMPIPGDYDGDNEDDFAVYRPGSSEVIVHVDGCGSVQRYAFPGVPAGKPIVGDFNGDGRDDAGVYVWETNTFYYKHFATDWTRSVKVGSQGIPVIGDYDGDGRSDFAVYAAGTWYIQRSSTGQTTTWSWGGWNDLPVPADYDGDGDTEIAVWAQTTGTWKINYGNRSVYQPTQWGVWGDIPVPAR